MKDSGISDHAAQFLATEHWSLLSARSLAWNESFSRVSVFLTTLSASAVALALVADASGFGSTFKIFASVLFPIVLFLGIGTYLRVMQINLEDLHLMAAMNRLRRAYIEDAPEIKPYLSSGTSDDEPGVWTSYLLGQPNPTVPLWIQLMVTTPTVVGTLNAVIAAAGVTAIVATIGAPDLVVAATAALVFLSVWLTLYTVQRRTFEMARRTTPRFPTD